MHSNHHSTPSNGPPDQSTKTRTRTDVRGVSILWAGLVLTVLLLLSALLPVPSVAVQGSNPAWTSFTSELADSNVRSILVDHEGEIWIGTRGGLSHFDGAWTTYSEHDGVPPGSVYAIAQTSDGVLWLGTAAGVAKSTEPGGNERLRFEMLPEPAGPVLALHVLPSGSVWVGSDGASGYWGPDGWRPLLSSDGKPLPDAVSAIATDAQGNAWLGGNTLYRYDARNGRLEAAPGYLGRGPIKALLVTQATEDWPETIWVGTQGDGLWGYNQQEWAHFSRPVETDLVEGIASNDVLALGEDDEGNLWIGTDGRGISLFNRAGLSPFWGGGYWRTLTTVDGLNANAVGALAIDRHGLVWIGTIYGANRFDSRSWQALSSPDLPAGLDVVTSMVDSGGVLWMGTEGSGLIRFDGSTLHRLTEEEHSLPENYVRALVEDDTGYLWVGTASQGVFRLDLTAEDPANSSQAATWERLDAGPLSNTTLRAAIRARDGSLWFGTYDTGIAHYWPDSGAWEAFTSENGLPTNEVNQNALLEDNQGHIWVGTPAGLGRFDPRAHVWRIFTTADGLDHNSVLSLAEMPAGQPGAGIWAGSKAGGVYRLAADTAQWQRIAASTVPVNALLAIPAQGVWWGGTNGLTLFDPATDLQRTYTRADGLVDNDISALVAGKTNETWIGTRLGINKHVPYDGRPWVEILTVNGKRPAANGLQVLSGEPVVISYAGHDLLTPDNGILYRVRLDGVDPTWQASTERQRTYRSLSPGVFEFHVEALNQSLNTSVPAASVKIRVMPSVELPVLGRLPQVTAFSIAALLLIAAAGAIGVLFLSLRQRRRRQEALRRRFNPYVSGDPIQSRDMFFGREEILARIVNMLHENSIMVHGERRIGKTSLLYRLANHLRSATDPEYLFIPVYIDLEGTPAEELFHLLMEEVLQVLPLPAGALPALRFHEVPKSAYSDRDFSYDMSDLLDALSASTNKEVRLILLLDEMDVINEYDPVIQQQLRRIFMRTFARNLGAVVAGIQISKQWDRVESPWYNLFNEIELGPLDDESARQLILEPVKGVYSYDPAAVDLIIEASQGRPYYIQQHCLEAVNSMLTAGRTRVTLEDAQNALATVTNARTS